MIKKIFLIMATLLLSLVGMVYAQPAQISDIAVYNLSVTENQESIEFDIVNNGNYDERDIQYGISLKDSAGQLIKKIPFPDRYTIASGARSHQKITYPVSETGASSLVLFVINNNGLPLTVSMVNVPETKKVIKKPVQKNTLNTCNVMDTEEGLLVSCEKQKQTNTFKVSIFEKTVFGKEIFSEETTWKEYGNSEDEQDLYEDINNKENIDGPVQQQRYQETEDESTESEYWLPQLDPGFYKIKIESNGFEKTLDVLVEGVYAKINRLALDKKSYQKNEKAIINIALSSSEEKVNMVYGMINAAGETCAISEKKWPTNIVEIPFITMQECAGATAFMVATDEEKNILSEYGTQGKSIEQLSKIKSSSVEKILFNWTYILYIAAGILVVGLITWLAKRKTLAVSLIIIAIMIAAAGFGYSKVFAATFAGQDNMYTVNFSQEKYGPEDVVSFTLSFFDKNTFTKNTDSSVSVAVDGGDFREVVSALDTEEVYQVALGNLSIGQHQIKLRGITAARFNSAKFGFSKFGQNNDDLVFTVTVEDNCVVDQGSWTPLAEQKCEGVLFKQNASSQCPAERDEWGTKQCPENFCEENPTAEECLTVDDTYCEKFPTSALCKGGSNYCTAYPTAPTCVACTVTETFPQPSEICNGVQFVQNTNCLDINYVKTGTNTTSSECIECTVDEQSWAPATNTYCAGDRFTQKSNCNSTKTAIGTDPSATCTPVQNAQLLCSTNLQSPWFACDSKIITLASGYSPLYIRPETDADKITDWLFQDADGGINATYKEGQNGLEDIISTMNPIGNGIYGKNKFYNLDVRAVGATNEYTTIQLKFINPVVVEI